LELGIEEYAIFKDYGDYYWVGNDLDVIVREEDFDKIHKHLMSSNAMVLERHTNWRKSKSHSKSIDLKADGLLNIDIHTAIGWRGVDVLKFNDVRLHMIKKSKFGIGYSALSSNLDAMIYAYSHILEKGFLVHLESKILKDGMPHFSTFGFRADFITSYLEYVTNLSECKNYPVFLPIRSIYSAFISLAKNSNKTKTFIRAIKIIALQLFWRARYSINGKLPFEIFQYSEINDLK
jgi:hypothetical protein